MKESWKLISLISAEVSFLLTLMTYSSSSLSYIVNPLFLLPLSIVPLLRWNKNPFSFEFLTILLAIYIPEIFPSTPLYTSFINAIYFAGFDNVARYIHSILVPQPTPILPLVIALFCFSQMIEREKIQYVGVALLLSLTSYLIYPFLLLSLKSSFLLAFLAVGILAIACWMLKLD